MTKEPRDKKHHGDHGGKPADQHHGSTAEETRALNETLKSFSEKYHKPDQKKDRRDRIKFWIEIGVAVGVAFNIALTGGLLIAGAFQASYSGEQVKASQGQLKIMDDTEKRQLRAYVGVVPGDLNDFGTAKQILHLTRKNFGTTPAYDVGFSLTGHRVIKVNEALVGVPGSGSACSNPEARPILQGFFTMFPTMELAWNVQIPQLPNDEIQVIRSATFQIVYFGDVCYRDAFGSAHYTNYCWMYKGASMTAKDAEGCLQHNDSN